MNFEDMPYWGQLLLIAGLCAGLGFVFYQFYYTPIQQEVRGLERNLQGIRDEIKQYRPFENRKGELEAEVQQIKANLEQLERIFPSVKDDVEIKRFVESVASEFDIVLLSYRTEELVDRPNYLERKVRLQTQGRTIDYLRFWDALTRRDQVVHIYSLNMSQRSTSGQFDPRFPVSAEFTVSSYVYKPLEE